MAPADKTPIPPRDPENPTGQSVLPLSRIKKIIKLDDDIQGCSQNAAYVTSVATEMFIQYITQQAHKQLVAEGKGRKTLQYKDFAKAVAIIDNLEFLADVIPTLSAPEKKPREKKAATSKKNAVVDAKQRTLTGERVVPIITTEEATAAGMQLGEDGERIPGDVDADEREEGQRHSQAKGKEKASTEPNDTQEDVEMT